MTSIRDPWPAWLRRHVQTWRSSFEVKVIALCVVSTITALLLAFGAFQWQDWRADRADLVND